ncbi:MAG: thiamine pyrophosphate-dependent enzyme, partial [Candidatus Methylomirabilales bacterium]
FESQLNVYKEITGCAIALNDPSSALEEIERTFETILRTKRPGYLEVPRDVADAKGRGVSKIKSVLPAKDPAALKEAMQEVIFRLNRSQRPVVYAGVEVVRFDLREKLIALVEKLNLPLATSIEGKAVFPEDHPNFVGIYMGRAGSELAREYVEGSDCLLMVGAFLTDVNTGLFTAKVDRPNVISASSEEIAVSYHRYPDVNLVDFIEYLLASDEVKRREFVKLERPEIPRPPSPGRLRTADVIEELNAFVVPGRYIVVSDVGDCLYASIDLRTDHFLGPGYYNSMGFGVPAAVAAQLAVPDRRAIALVGDGGFQMTGMELSTAKKLGLNPIVILWNNGGYATMRAIAGRKPYFDLHPWDYVGIAKALGGRGIRVETRGELREALKAAEGSPVFSLIEVVISSDDISPAWQRIAKEVKARISKR